MSEFEQKNEEAFGMIRQNRDCHPGGTPVHVVTDAYLNDLIQRAESAERAAWESKETITNLEFQLRTYQLIRVAYILGAAALAFLIGVSV